MSISTFLVKINTTELPKVKRFAVGRNKLWSDAGRNMAGELRSTFLGVYPKISIEFAHTTSAEQTTILNLLDLASFSLQWYDPRSATHKTGTYYAGDFETAIYNKEKGLYEPFKVNLVPFKRVT